MRKTGFFKKIANKFRHNLVLFTLQKNLSKITGIIIFPSYLFQIRQPDTFTPPKIKDDHPASYKIEILKENDIKTLANYKCGYSEAQLIDFYKNEVLFIGVKHNQLVVSFHMINLKECDFEPYKFKLKSNETYAYGLFTIEPYRGKNLAAFQVYHTIKILKKMNKDTMYIMNEYFNTATLMATKKYNATPIKLILYIRLFKRFRWTKVLKTYNNSEST